MATALALLVLSGEAELRPASREEKPGAPDETEQLLIRAREGLAPTRRDRDLAQAYLQEWEDAGPDDPALRRAFQRIADGFRPAGGQLSALTRLHENYLDARAEAIARKEGRLYVGWGGRARRAIRGRSSLRSYAAVAIFACVVFAAGVGLVLIVRRRRTA